MAKRSSELETYRRKRDFTKTSEPAPRRVAKRAAARGGRFVVQHHWARREHYDFRIEMDDVLKSWAVTKPPSPDPAVKRLAVRTEDHPLDYATFEGTIPKGEYGGGTVMLWDEGTWEPADPDPAAALKKGQLKMMLQGQRMKGGWVLVRLKSEGKRENWLLIKERDDHVERGGDLGSKYVTSVATGRSKTDIEENRPSRKRKPKAAKESTAVTARAGSRRVAPFLPLMMCELREHVPEGPDWLHEVKYDGYRVEAAVAGADVRLYSREGLDWTHRFGTVPEALAGLDLPSVVLDGEAVVFDAKGVSNFAALVDALELEDEQDRLSGFRCAAEGQAGSAQRAATQAQGGSARSSRGSEQRHGPGDVLYHRRRPGSVQEGGVRRCGRDHQQTDRLAVSSGPRWTVGEGEGQQARRCGGDRLDAVGAAALCLTGGGAGDAGRAAPCRECRQRLLSKRAQEHARQAEAAAARSSAGRRYFRGQAAQGRGVGRTAAPDRGRLHRADPRQAAAPPAVPRLARGSNRSAESGGRAAAAQARIAKIAGCPAEP